MFERQGRRTIPTAKGQELAQALGEAFGIMGVACRRMAQSDSGPALTIAALPSIATIWLIPRMSRFFAAHPEIAIKVVYAFDRPELNFDDYDLAILWGPPDWQNCKMTRLLAGDTVAVCSASFLEKEGPFADPDILSRKTLLHDTDRTGWQSFMRAIGLKHAGPAAGPIFQDFNLLRAAALAGQGLALCPRALIEDDLASGRLAQPFAASIKPDHAYWLLEPEDGQSRQAAAIALLKSWLLSQADSAPPRMPSLQG
ncbi:LysR substrate-binding domain-containing protein [Aestuariivirga sp.]|uniref:LysR substrate-binding domain-containing protein n=1 Tax=Aestuariivirga sp. TaxID=2650926 RepID=UPI0039E6F751